MAFEQSPTMPHKPGMVNPVSPDLIGMHEPPAAFAMSATIAEEPHGTVLLTFGKEVFFELGQKVRKEGGAFRSVVQSVVNDSTSNTLKVAHTVDPVRLDLDGQQSGSTGADWETLTSHG